MKKLVAELVAGDTINLGTLRVYEITKIQHYASGRIGVSYRIPNTTHEYYDTMYQSRTVEVIEKES